MYISSNKRNPQFFDIWKLDTETWTPTLFYQNDSSLQPSVISNNEQYIALSKAITTDKSELYLYDRISRTTHRISNDNEATWNAMAFEKNDSILYYTTNDGAEFSYLVKYNVNTHASEKLFEDKWDVAGMILSENEKYHTEYIDVNNKNNLFAKINLGKYLEDICSVKTTSKIYYDKPLNNLSKIKIQIIDYYGNIVNIKNDHNFTLDITEIKNILRDTLLDTNTNEVVITGYK